MHCSPEPAALWGASAPSWPEAAAGGPSPARAVAPRCLCQSGPGCAPGLTAKMEAPRFLRLWVLAVVVLGGARGSLPDLSLSSETGAIFVHELEREPFQEAFLAAREEDAVVPEGPITFQPHLGGHPDLPRWLRYAQRGPSEPGYLYGSPTAAEVGTHVIEVLAYNRDTYETAVQRVIVTVVPSPAGEPPYQGEFFVANRNVEEMLPAAARQLFRQAVDGVWEQDDLSIINITSALDRGGRVPLPIEGRKEGVYVKVGSRAAFSRCLASAASAQSRFRCSLGQQPVATCYDTFGPQFAIDWCNLTLLEVSASPTALGPVWGTGLLENGSDFAPPTASPAGDFLAGYLLTILVPLLVAALLCLLLGHLMCCRREGVQKRDMETSDIQLLHHTTIHGNAEELRRMAGSRDDVPRPLSTLPMFNVRTGQRADPTRGLGDTACLPLLPRQR
ncbi:alpha-sarcoglycan isoform X2 [Struthio camelus]|uniref:alpha-sarcoglycan isoform X2 n=2 Tax=Struthio camelus TaxID=8801 RepID=UPI003603EF49